MTNKHDNLQNVTNNTTTIPKINETVQNRQLESLLFYTYRTKQHGNICYNALICPKKHYIGLT